MYLRVLELKPGYVLTPERIRILITQGDRSGEPVMIEIDTGNAALNEFQPRSFRWHDYDVPGELPTRGDGG